MSKLHKVYDDFYAFHCPGCGRGHAVSVNGSLNSWGASWVWNGSMDSPTFTPSINCHASTPEIRCHSFVRDGNIEFLSDSFHALAGKTVPLPEWD